MRLILPLFLLAPALLPAPPGPAVSAPLPILVQDQRPPLAEARFAAAREMLDAGKPAEAAVEALAGLAFAPYDVRGYELMLECARAGDDRADELRWRKWLYWADKYAGREDEAAARAAELEALEPNWDLDEPLIDAWTDAALEAARVAVKNKQYRLAGHLYDKVLNLRQGDERLLAEFDKLAKKAGEQLSGGAFVAATVRRRSPAWIRRQNEKHADWEHAFERRTRHLEVKTTISYELFETVSVVMEDMFDFYRDIYDFHKKAPRMTLALHRSRADFDRFNHEELGWSLPLGVLGWFFPKDRLVAAFVDDVVYDINEADLFNTLFHECSHYFMHLLTERAGVPIPGWLNEGTASYFEGCELKADGTIVKNKPALSRVRSWEALESGSNRLSLKELVSFQEPGSYPGHYYPYGWSFVYFLLNYEKDDPRVTGAQPVPGPDGKPVLPVGPLVYRDAYLKALKSYTVKQKKNGESSYERCVRIFVDEVDDPEVPDWDAFEERWRRFIRAVVRETKAGPEFADTLQARCRGYLLAGDFERALIAAEQADDKRPNDAETYRLTALAQEGLGRDEEAIYWMLRHWEQAIADGDEAAAAAAESWLEERRHQDLVAGYCRPTREALAGILAAMAAADEAGQPYLGQLFAAHFVQAAGIDPAELGRKRAELAEKSGRDLRLWQRAFPEGSVAERKGRIAQEADGSVLLFAPENAAQPSLWVTAPNLRWLEPPYDIRGRIQIDGRNAAEILIGRGPNGLPQRVVEIENGATVSFVEVEQRFEEESASGNGVTTYSYVKRQSLPSAQNYDFVLSLGDEEGEGEIRIGDEFRATVPADWTPADFTGVAGISVGDDTAAMFQDLEIRPREAFWPVAPRQDDQD